MSEYPYGMIVVAIVGLLCAFLWAREPSTTPEAVSIAAPAVTKPWAPTTMPQPMASSPQQFPAIAQGMIPPAAPPVMRAVPPSGAYPHN